MKLPPGSGGWEMTCILSGGVLGRVVVTTWRSEERRNKAGLDRTTVMGGKVGAAILWCCMQLLSTFTLNRGAYRNSNRVSVRIWAACQGRTTPGRQCRLNTYSSTV